MLDFDGLELPEETQKALKRNKKEFNTYVLIGDIHFKMKQYTIAKRYYDACLKLNYKLHFHIRHLSWLSLLPRRLYPANAAIS